MQIKAQNTAKHTLEWQKSKTMIIQWVTKNVVSCNPLGAFGV